MIMKKLILSLAILLAAYRCPAPIESDLVAGIDPTGYSSITAANLLMLVSNGTIGQTNKGAILRGPNTPDTVNNPRYTNFIWMDTSLGLPGILKQWSGSSWVSAVFGNQAVQATNIANGAVGSAQLGTNSVQTYHIANNAVDNTKIGAGQILNTHLGLGVVSNANIADLTIQGGKVAYNTLGGTNIIDASVNGTKLVNQSVTGTQLANGSVGNLTLTTNAVANTNIASGAVDHAALGTNSVYTNNISINGGSAYQVLQVDPTASFARWGTIPLFSVATISAGAVVAGPRSYTNAHGLGGRPIVLRCVITNTTPELGYAVGDEVELSNIDSASGDAPPGPLALTFASDATSVYIAYTSVWAICNKNAATGRAAITAGNWGFKIYALR